MLKTFEVEKVPASLLPSTGKEGALTSLVQGVWPTVEGRRSHLLAGLEWWPLLALHCTAKHCRLRVAKGLFDSGGINLLIERGNYSD